MTSSGFNENDFESPGYEYLRSYQNMNNLYHKLVALDYQKEFCPLYRCPPIHRYYFSMPSKNPSEQQFLFTCLCAWLIKDKCQMNLDIEPEEYEDPDVITSVVLEALRLLLIPEDDTRDMRNCTSDPVSFPPGRLKQGFGPEVIWTVNVLADRALELMLESDTISRKPKIAYICKGDSDVNQQSSSNFILVGQPFVGGGLTTRPLGKYQIDDKSLLFDDEAEATGEKTTVGIPKNSISSEEWYRLVKRATPTLEAIQLVDDDDDKLESWQSLALSAKDSKKILKEFASQSRSLMEVVTRRIDRQLQVISSREKFIQTNLTVAIENFIKIWRDFSAQLNRQTELLGQVDLKTDKFENLNENLKEINENIELRIKELKDGSKLKKLEKMISQLQKESDEFDIKIGLLLTACSRQEAKTTAESEK